MAGVNERDMHDDGERCQGSGVVESNIDAIPPTRLSSALAIVVPDIVDPPVKYPGHP